MNTSVSLDAADPLKVAALFAAGSLGRQWFKGSLHLSEKEQRYLPRFMLALYLRGDSSVMCMKDAARLMQSTDGRTTRFWLEFAERLQLITLRTRRSDERAKDVVGTAKLRRIVEEELVTFAGEITALLEKTA